MNDNQPPLWQAIVKGLVMAVIVWLILFIVLMTNLPQAQCGVAGLAHAMVLQICTILGLPVMAVYGALFGGLLLRRKRAWYWQWLLIIVTAVPASCLTLAIDAWI